MEMENKSPVGLRVRYLMLIDVACILLSIVVTFIIRYEALIGVWPYLRHNWTLFLVALLVRLPVYYYFRLYQRLWRYASTREFKVIALAGASGSALIYIVNFWLLPFVGISYCPSHSIIILEGVLSLACLGGTRFALRLLQERITLEEAARLGVFVQNPRQVLIAGAGSAGEMTLREIQNNPAAQGVRVVGFVDDDRAKLAMHIHGVPVLGTREDIPALVQKQHVSEVIIAMPSAPPFAIDDICHICSTARVPVRTLPSIYDFLTGTLTFEQVRQLRTAESHGPLPGPAADNEPSVLHNVMVTGGAGFIGSNFTRYMLETYPAYRIIVYDKLTYAGNMDNLLGLSEAYGERYVFVKGDICNYAQVAEAMQRYAVDAVVNFAAESHVDRSLMDPESFLNTNVYGTYALLRAARHFHVRRYHQVSTDEVYGQVIRGAFGEDDPLETRSPYSASKAGADLLVHAYCVSFGVLATVSRGSNNIGPYQYPEKAVPLFITNALADQPLPVYGDGLYVRDYQYVIDHCRGIDLILHQGVPGEIYNLGGGNEVAAMDLARAILDRLGKPQSLIHLVTDRPGQDRRYSLNCAKAKALGWKPMWTFNQAIDDTIAWYLENEWWWRKLKTAEYWQYYDKQYRERLDEAMSRA